MSYISLGSYRSFCHIVLDKRRLDDVWLIYVATELVRSTVRLISRSLILSKLSIGHLVLARHWILSQNWSLTTIGLWLSNLIAYQVLGLRRVGLAIRAGSLPW